MKKEKIINVYLILTSVIVLLFGIMDVISFINSIVTEKGLYFGYLFGLALIIMAILVLVKKKKMLILSSVFYLLTAGIMICELKFNLQILQLLVFGVINILIYILDPKVKQ